MAEFNKPTFDESEIVAGLRNVQSNLINMLEVMRKAQKDFGEFANIGDDNLEKLETALDQVNNALKEQQNQVKKNKKETESWGSSLGSAIKDIRIMGVSLGDVTGKLDAQVKSIRAFTAAQKGATVAAKALRAALLAIPLVAIATALGGIVSFLTRTKEGSEALRRVTAGLSAAMGVLSDTLAPLGKLLFETFSNPKKALTDLANTFKNLLVNQFNAAVGIVGALGKAFQAFRNRDVIGLKDAVSEAGDQVLQLVTGLDKTQRSNVADTFRKGAEQAKNLGKNLSDAFELGAQLEAQAQSIVDRQRELNVAYAEARAEIKRLNKIAEDTNKSEVERADAARAAIELEQKFLEDRIALAEEELSVIQQRNAISSSLEKDLDAEADARANIAQLQEASLELQTTLTNKLNTIEAQRLQKEKAIADAIKKQREEFESQVKVLEEIAEGLELEGLDPVERLQKEFEVAREQVKLAVTQAKLLAETKEDFERIERAGNEAILELTRKYYRDRQDLEEEATQGIKDIREKAIDDLVKRNAGNVSDVIGDQAPEITSALDKLKLEIGNALGFDAEESQGLFQLIGTAYDQIIGGITARTDKLIEENNRRLDELQSRREELEGQLEEENARAEEGLANRVGATQRALASIKEEEEKAQAEAEELARRRARQEAIQAAVAQVNNLITAATSIFTWSSSIPFAGIAIGAAAIASMIAAVASAKQKAKSVATRAYTGGDLAELIGARRQGSDNPAIGDGYMVGDTGVMIGGEEFVLNADTYRKHKPFVKALNAGKFDHMNLSGVIPDLAATSSRFGMRNDTQMMREAEQTKRLFRQEFGEKIELLRRDMIRTLQDKPELVAVNKGAEIYEVRKGKLRRWKA